MTPHYDTQPSSHSSSTSELDTLKLSWTLPLHRHALIHIQRVVWAAHISVDEVGLQHPSRFIDERDVGGVVLDLAHGKGFAGTVGGREGG